MTQQRLRRWALLLLFIGFLDEFLYGAWEAALPLIRTDIGLSYQQIGLLISIPALFSVALEPFLFILSDAWNRKRIMLGGAVGFTAGLLMTAAAQTFGVMMAAFAILFPSSGAFVAVSQGALVDDGSGRQEKQMARWALAGALGVVLGPALIWLALQVGVGWREIFAGCAVLLILAGIAVAAFRIEQPKPQGTITSMLRAGFGDVWQAAKQGNVQRWLVLLQISNLLLDVMIGFLALYFVDVVAVTEAQAAVAIIVVSVVGLVGDAIVLRLLEHVRGITVLRISAFAALFIFASFLLIPGYIPKLVILGLLSLSTSGWYAILQAQLYSALPGRSGTTLTLTTLSYTFTGLMPLILGVVAQQANLTAAMWLLIAGPVVLIIGLMQAEGSSIG